MFKKETPHSYTLVFVQSGELYFTPLSLMFIYCISNISASKCQIASYVMNNLKKKTFLFLTTTQNNLQMLLRGPDPKTIAHSDSISAEMIQKDSHTLKIHKYYPTQRTINSQMAT